MSEQGHRRDIILCTYGVIDDAELLSGNYIAQDNDPKAQKRTVIDKWCLNWPWRSPEIRPYKVWVSDLDLETTLYV